MDRTFNMPSTHSTTNKDYVCILIPVLFVIVMFMIYAMYSKKQNFAEPTTYDPYVFDDTTKTSDNILDYSK